MTSSLRLASGQAGLFQLYSQGCWVFAGKGLALESVVRGDNKGMKRKPGREMRGREAKGR